MPSPRAERWEQKEGNMKRFEFTLKEFWLRSMEPVYNLDTGELINATKMNEGRNLEVVAFWAYKDGIGVKLENEDMEEE